MQQPNPQNPQQPYPPGQYPMQPQQAPQYPPGQYPPNHPAAPPVPAQRGCAKDVLIVVIGIVAAVYVVWPSIFPDFVPDIVPLIGQIDDDTAVLVILACFRYFGLDLTNVFGGLNMLRGRR